MQQNDELNVPNLDVNHNVDMDTKLQELNLKEVDGHFTDSKR